MFVLYDAHIIK